MTPILFPCEDETLVGALHAGSETTGVVIVTGGAQVRAGPQRLFVRLATDLAAQGYPVLRFDRRGIGDSSGVDPGFLSSAPDIIAAADALRKQQAAVSRVVGIGLCDGATALALCADGSDELILLNPWVIQEGAPPTKAAVTAHYRRRFFQLAAWKRILTGGSNPLAALRGLFTAALPAPTSALEERVMTALLNSDRPAHIILSSRDRSADVFRPLLKRMSGSLTSVVDIDADHAFSHPDSYAVLAHTILAILSRQ